MTSEYLRGRFDEAKETLRVIEIVRRLGYLEFDQCLKLIDYLETIERIDK